MLLLLVGPAGNIVSSPGGECFTGELCTAVCELWALRSSRGAGVKWNKENRFSEPCLEGGHAKELSAFVDVGDSCRKWKQTQRRKKPWTNYELSENILCSRYCLFFVSECCVCIVSVEVIICFWNQMIADLLQINQTNKSEKNELA